MHSSQFKWSSETSGAKQGGGVQLVLRFSFRSGSDFHRSRIHPSCLVCSCCYCCYYCYYCYYCGCESACTSLHSQACNGIALEGNLVNSVSENYLFAAALS